MESTESPRRLLLAALVLALSACGDRDPVATPVATEPAPPPIDEALPGAPDPAMPGTGMAPPADATATHFARLDTDKSGLVTAEEHAQAAAAMFRTMDGNGDGGVTAAEMDAAQATLGGDTRMASADKIKAIDSNDDGKLTTEEHADGSRTMFATMDTDGDGRLSPAEVQAGHDRMMGGAAAQPDG